MLKELRIHNLILVEFAEISFESGLNVLTGETGSGKSAILGALCLILGDRADTSMIRQGAAKSIVEAAFEPTFTDAIRRILEEGGIDYEEGTPLIIRREILATGKSRAFINNQMAQLGLLKQLGLHLSEVVSQHANRKLMSTDSHREIVDTFGDLDPLRTTFAKGWELEKTLKAERDKLIKNEAERIREISVCRRELNEIAEARLKECEEEEIFSEYQILSNAEELTHKTTRILETLNEESHGTLQQLRSLLSQVEGLVSIDPSLKEIASIVKSAAVELNEASYSLEHYLSKIDNQPDRAEWINDRLSLITQMKKKYGPTIEDVLQYERATVDRLEALENADNRIDEIQTRLVELEKQNTELAKTLTERRLTAADTLSSAIVSELRSLNMPKVDFSIVVTPRERGLDGEDKIEFYLVPNIGEKAVSVTNCASGGELSRLLLTIHTLLSEKNRVPLLVFDEVDANIGGETASKVGQKLRGIAKHKQVLCITHFPQVAAYADHHLRISKGEFEGRTISRVEKLHGSERESELQRMVGNGGSLQNMSHAFGLS